MVAVRRYLEAELGTAQVGFVLLPESVGFYEQRGVNAGWEGLLQRAQHWLDAVPLAATHVHHHCKTAGAHILAGDGWQVSDQAAKVLLLYSIVVGAGREGQDGPASLVAPT